MMIQLFDVQDKKVVPNQNTYLIPETALIIETFTKEYLKALAYVFFTTCPDGSNVYVNLDENIKEDVILSDLKPFTFDLEDPIITRAIEKCKLLYETPTLRGFMGAKKALDRVGAYLADTEITEGKDGTAMIIDRYMSKLKDFTDVYSAMENKLKEEQAKVRGGAKIRYDQAPDYKNMKED